MGETPACLATSRIVTLDALTRCYQYHTCGVNFISEALTPGLTIWYR
jgi:hypothetical protein